VLRVPQRRTSPYERTAEKNREACCADAGKASLAMRAGATSIRNDGASGIGEGFVGQERALRALKMGVELARRATTFSFADGGDEPRRDIARMIEELKPGVKESRDRCYVNNFKITDRPRLITLPRGHANGFKKDMQAGIDFLRRRIPQVFEGERFSGKRAALWSGSPRVKRLDG